MEYDFSLPGYRRLLEELLAQGYQIRSYAEAVPDQQHVILRHDVDFCLERSIPIAEIEADLGVSASYFVLMGSEFYNVLAPSSQARIRQLLNLGQKIGLHFDAAPFEGAGWDALCDEAKKECLILEDIIGLPVEMISFHRPAQELLGKNATIAGRMHTYQPQFFDQMGYCSDSRGEWRYGHPQEHEAVRNQSALQLLTHPIWWAEEGPSPSHKLGRFIEKRQHEIFAEMGRQSNVSLNVD